MPLHAQIQSKVFHIWMDQYQSPELMSENQNATSSITLIKILVFYCSRLGILSTFRLNFHPSINVIFQSISFPLLTVSNLLLCCYQNSALPQAVLTYIISLTIVLLAGLAITLWPYAREFVKRKKCTEIHNKQY